MSASRLSKRAAWFLAAGCGVLAVAALGLAVWLSRSPSTAAPISTARVVKLLITDEGMVSVTPSQIGWDGIDPATVQVKHDGAIQPVWIDGDALRFYAPISLTRYMSETVFWLERGDRPGAEIPAQPIASHAEPRPDRSLHGHAARGRESRIFAASGRRRSLVLVTVVRSVHYHSSLYAHGTGRRAGAVDRGGVGQHSVACRDRSPLSRAGERSAAGRVRLGRPGAAHHRGGCAARRAARRRKYCDVYPAWRRRRDGRHHVLELA